MTPARMTELKCPRCATIHWVIDSDFRGIDGADDPYEQRPYACPGCGECGAGHEVLRQSPPEFFLQPHPSHPMTIRDFGWWLRILMEHFPDSEKLQQLGASWYPSQYDDRPPARRQVVKNDRFSLTLRPGARALVLAQAAWNHVFESPDGALVCEALLSIGPPVDFVRQIEVSFHSAAHEARQTRVPLEEVVEAVEEQRDELLRAWRRYRRDDDRRRDDLLATINRAMSGRRVPKTKWWHFW